MLWLYLARRDQKGVRILNRLRGDRQPAVRITDLSPLNLPNNTRQEIEQLIFDERMMWEAWIESSDDFDALRAALKKRGYKNVPVSGQPEITSTTRSVNTSKLPKPQTMLRADPD